MDRIPRLPPVQPQVVPRTLKRIVAEEENEPELMPRVFIPSKVGPSRVNTSRIGFPEMVSRYCPPQAGTVAVPVAA